MLLKTPVNFTDKAGTFLEMLTILNFIWYTNLATQLNMIAMGVVFLFSIKMHTLSLHTLVVIKVVSQQSELCVVCALTSVGALFVYGGVFMKLS